MVQPGKRGTLREGEVAIHLKLANPPYQQSDAGE